MTGADTIGTWPLLPFRLDDFSELWRESPAEVVLLHPGLGGNRDLFRPWVPVFADTFRVLRFDARGQGRCARPDGYRFTLERWLDDVLTLLDHLEIDRVHWVGTSGGGIIGQYAALTVPDRIGSLSLIATTAHFRGPGGDYNDWIAPLDGADAEGFLRRDLERRFGTDNPARTNWIIEELSRTPAAILAELHRWVRTVDLTNRVQQIQCPTLVVTGADDTLTSLDEARFLACTIPDARLEVLPNRPHNVAYTHPREVAAIVRDFLAGVHKRDARNETRETRTLLPE